jgi:GNAT superfamily N-acetyltransferase
MDEIAELHRLAGRATAAIFESEKAEVRITAGGALILSGEPVADLNMLVLASPPSPAAAQLLAESAALIVARDLPLVALAPPDTGAVLAATAARLGLEAAGTMPLMVLRGPPRGQPLCQCRIEDAAGAAGQRIATDLASAAFQLPADALGRAWAASFGDTSGARTYVAYDDATPVSSVTVTRQGATAGIWCMSTPPERQGRGFGRGLLTGVIDELRSAGVARFYLFATAAGRPLYAALGFETLAEDAVWVKGHSTQTTA